MNNRHLNLIRDYLDERISEDDLAELNQVLETDAGVRAQFRLMATVEAGLCDLAAIPEEPPAPSPSSRPRFTAWAGLVAAACVVFVIALAASKFLGGDPGKVKMTPGVEIAYVEKIDGYARLDESELLQGSSVFKGAIHVESGLLELRFEHGTTLQVHGPTDLSIDSEMQVSLVRGQVAARVSENAHGFTVLGPDSAVVDLGTEFAIAVEGGKSWVEVYDGEVEIALLNEHGHAWKSRQLSATGAVRIDASNGQIVEENPPVALPRVSEALMEPLEVPSAYIECVRNCGPVHYWRFEDADDDRVVDIAGGAAAVLDGGARLQDDGVYSPRGRKNHGYLFVASPEPLLLNDEFSVEIWVNPSHVHRSTLIDINHREPNSNHREKLYRLSLMPAEHQSVYPGESFRFGGQLWPYGGAGSVCVFSADRYTPGCWHHVVVVRRRELIEIYLNGGTAETTPAPPLTKDPLAATIAIGAFLRSQQSGTMSGQSFFKGMIDEVAVYPKALTGEEISRHHRLMQVK